MRSLVARIGRAQVGVRWYLFALAYMPALKLSAAAMTRITTGSWLVAIPLRLQMSGARQADDASAVAV